MPRPLKFDKETVIKQAMEILWRDGYEASSVKAMSEALGMTRSSYYNAFGSREDLFKAAMMAYFYDGPYARLFDDVPEGVSALLLMTRSVLSMCDRLIELSEGRGCLMVNSLAELGGEQTELSAFLKDMVTQGTERIETLLKLAVAMGELPDNTDTHAKALALQSLMFGMCVLSKNLDDNDALRRSVKESLAGLSVYRDE